MAITPLHEEEAPSTGTELSAGARYDEWDGGAGGEPAVVRPRAVAVSIFTLLRYKWLILGVFAIVAGAGSAGVWLLTVPQYRAEALIEVSPVIPRLVYKTEESGPIPLYERFLNSQAGIMRSIVLQRALDQPTLQQTRWYREPGGGLTGPQGTPTERLKAQLSVSPRAASNLIEVSMVTPLARESATIVNTVVDEYMKYVAERGKGKGDEILSALTERVNTYYSSVKQKEETVARLMRDLGTTLPETMLVERRKRLDELELNLENLKKGIATEEWKLKQLDEVIKARGGAGAAASQPSDTMRYETDSEWRQLNVQVKSQRNEIEIQKMRIGADNPRLKEMQMRLELSMDMLQSRERQIDERYRMEVGQGVTGDAGTSTVGTARDKLVKSIEMLQYQKTLMEDSVRTQRAQVDRTREQVEQLNKEQATLADLRASYDEVKKRLDEKEMERHAPGAIKIVSIAYAPTVPHKDRRGIFTAMAVVGGLALGVGLAYAWASLSPSILNVDQIGSSPSAPFLGQIPLQRPGQSPSEMDLLVRNECIRMVRTAMLQRLDQRRGNVILVTSAGPGAGKTSVAVLLAESLAHCGKRVLLVDTDFRTPSVAARLGLSNEPGLLATLTQRATDGAAIVSNGSPGLSVLPAGTMSHVDETEMLADGSFVACLARWRANFDLVVLDSPPILPVADARIMSRFADGTLLVVREGNCRRSDLVACLAQLHAAGGKLLGTVFIGSSRNRGYGSPYYGYPARKGREKRELVLDVGSSA